MQALANLKLRRRNIFSQPSSQPLLRKVFPPKAIQLGPDVAQLPQRIWEADPKEGPIWIYKWDISYAFHCCNLMPFYVCRFDYVVPLVRSATSCILCIDLVPSTGCVNSPDFFWSASENITKNYFWIYPPTAEVYHTSTSPPVLSEWLQCIINLIYAAQGDAVQQQRVLEMTLPRPHGYLLFRTRGYQGLSQNEEGSSWKWGLVDHQWDPHMGRWQKKGNLSLSC